MGQVQANVSMDRPVITRVNRLITFKVRLPLSINLVVDLQVDDGSAYDVTGVVRSTSRCGRSNRCPSISTSTRPGRVTCRSWPHTGARAEMVRFVAQVDDEIKRIHRQASHSGSGRRRSVGRVIDVAGRTRQGDADLTGVIGAASVESGERRR